jgi:hypothetical protein
MDRRGPKLKKKNKNKRKVNFIEVFLSLISLSILINNTSYYKPIYIDIKS